MAGLYALHPRPLTVLFGEIESFALGSREVSVGTGGGVLERENASGFRFYAHQYYDAFGKKKERYVSGPVGGADAEKAVADLRTRIEELRQITPSLRLLGREGFQIADARTYAAVAAMHNGGLFRAGATLIGSHAYGVLLNRLGIRAASYETEDIDIARGRPMEFAGTSRRDILEVLQPSGIEFIEVPQLDVREPATSWKQKGRSIFRVDLLAPARGRDIGSVAVPELNAHATTLPFLGYLLAETQMTALIAREGACAIRVPLPERFAIHKLLVSAMRPGRDAKLLKDRDQAAVLCAVLGDQHPGALASAVAEVPRLAMKQLREGIAAVRDVLEERYPRAWEELGG
jgi:hypothetical protein